VPSEAAKDAFEDAITGLGATLSMLPRVEADGNEACTS